MSPQSISSVSITDDDAGSSSEEATRTRQLRCGATAMVRLTASAPTTATLPAPLLGDAVAPSRADRGRCQGAQPGLLLVTGPELSPQHPLWVLWHSSGALSLPEGCVTPTSPSVLVVKALGKAVVQEVKKAAVKEEVVAATQCK